MNEDRSQDRSSGDYRSDANEGQGWLLVYEFYRSLYEGDDCQRETAYVTLGEARLAARQLGCASGIAAVSVVAADERERVVCSWDKRQSPYWHDADFIAAFEHELDRKDRLPASPAI